MKLKITKTLIESWAYTFNCFEGYEEDAYSDFLKTLNREHHRQRPLRPDGSLKSCATASPMARRLSMKHCWIL